MKLVSALVITTATGAAAFAPAPSGRVTESSALSVLPDSLDIPSTVGIAKSFTIASTTAGDAATSTDLASVGAVAAATATNPIEAAAAAVGVALASAFAWTSQGASSNSATVVEAEPEKIDVSIPYDAAAALSYCNLKGIGEIDDMQAFEEYKVLYEALSIAQVSFKKATREYDAYVKATF